MSPASTLAGQARAVLTGLRHDVQRRPIVQRTAAEGFAGARSPCPVHVAKGLRDLGAVDLAVYSAVADTPTPSLDEPLGRLSNAANNSGLWFAIAAALALAGGGAGRRAPGPRCAGRWPSAPRPRW